MSMLKNFHVISSGYIATQPRFMNIKENGKSENKKNLKKLEGKNEGTRRVRVGQKAYRDHK